MTEPVVIGVGGNIGSHAEIVERFGHARAAIAELAAPAGLRSAPLYLSAPIGPAQPAYLNTAVMIEFAGGQPAELLAALLEIERMLGRRREAEARWGPRPLDLDVLVWGARSVATPELEVPHPRLAERKFALAPLVELVGEAFEVPRLGRAGGLLARVVGQDCAQIAASW